MNLLGLKMGWVEKVVAVIVLSALVMGAFPVSFASAEGEEAAPAAPAASSLVMEGEEGDLCDNMIGLQLVIPEGWMADGSACYPIDPVEPVIETIVICKYDADRYEEDGENSLPIAGWRMLVTNTLSEIENPSDQIYEVTTGDDGCTDIGVNPDNGPWYVLEQSVEGWRLVDIEVLGGTLENNEDFAYCQFFDTEVILAKSAVSESRNVCAFYNRDSREAVTGYKWNDENNDGVKDESEDGVEGWTITATDNTKAGYSSVSAVTDENGFYSMLLPDDGNWIITEEVRSGWTQTAVFENGMKLTAETEEGGSTTECSLYLGSKYTKISVSDEIVAPELYNRCDFLNYQEPRRSGGGSGTRVKDRTTPTPQVLGASTTAPACGMYLNDYMRQGKEASSTEVTKLQIFLNAVGIKLEVTGMFDAATDAAVRKFQGDHKAEVLTPWYLAKLVPHENPTGWVYQLTRWKINNIVCPGSEAYPVLN